MPNPQIMAAMRQRISAVMRDAGQTAVWRDFISGSANVAELGLGTGHIYSQRVITGLFDLVRPEEVITVAGQYMVGDVRLTTLERVDKRDEIIWEGNRYLSIQGPASVNLFGTAMNQVIIRRG